MAAAIRVRETRRVAGQFNWLHSFHHHEFPPSSEMRAGRGGGTRTPADAVLETAALATELHLFRTPPNKKAASVDPGRLAYLGLVVSRFKTSTSAPRRP